MNLKQLKKIKAILVSRKATLPILEYFYITPDSVYATNLEAGIIARHQYPVKGEGPCVVDAEHFIKRLEHIKAPWHLFVNENTGKAETVSVSGSTTLRSLPPKEYDGSSILPFIDRSKHVSVCQIGIDEIILFKEYRKFIADDNLRPAMAAVCIDNEYLVASDAHKLIRRKIKAKGEQRVLVPLKPLLLFELFPATYDIYKHNNLYFAISADVTIWWKAVDGNYPSWISVIPKETPKAVIIPVAETIAALNSIEFSANKASYLVKITIKGSKMELLANDLDISISSSEILDIVNEAPEDNKGANDIVIGAKIPFLIEILSTLQALGYSSVDMRYTDNTKCLLFAGDILLMPMIVSE